MTQATLDVKTEGTVFVTNLCVVSVSWEIEEYAGSL